MFSYFISWGSQTGTEKSACICVWKPLLPHLGLFWGVNVDPVKINGPSMEQSLVPTRQSALGMV